jgi:hypothetical protein
MSHLPLMPGDDIRIIVLAPTYPKDSDGLTCYHDERYAPIGFPIYAEYDDDYQFRNIREINDYNERYFRGFATLYMKDSETYSVYGWNGLEEFLHDVINDDLYVDNLGEKMKLKHVMIHGELYHALIENMRQRVPYNQEKSFGELMERKILETMNWLIKSRDLAARVMQNKELIKGLDDDDFDLFGFDNFSDKIKVGSVTRWRTLDIMAKFFVETEDYRLLDDILEYILWNNVMGFSRNGYYCLSGAGSQSQEMMIQKIVAEFIVVKCTEREAAAIDESEGYGEEIDSSVLEETLYWWDN